VSASTCSMTALTSACKSESPICCISTEAAIPPKISARIYAPQTMRHPCADSCRATRCGV
jgi:hypothetical protein